MDPEILAWLKWLAYTTAVIGGSVWLLVWAASQKPNGD